MINNKLTYIVILLSFSMISSLFMNTYRLNFNNLKISDPTKEIKYNDNPITSQQHVRVIFLHHSCGSNLITEGSVREWFTANNTDFWDHGYNGDGLTNQDGVSLGYSYDVPSDNTFADGLDDIFQQNDKDPSTCFKKFLHGTDGIDCGLEFDLFIIKACFPENWNPTPDDAYQRFLHYRNIRDRCDDFPNRIFIIVTAPPLNNDVEIGNLEGNNITRKYCWDYMTNGTFLEGHSNCFVWDWNYLLSNHTPSSDDYCGLREDYQIIEYEDSHPNYLANSQHGQLFVNFTLSAINNYSISLSCPSCPLTTNDDDNAGDSNNATISFDYFPLIVAMFCLVLLVFRQKRIFSKNKEK